MPGQSRPATPMALAPVVYRACRREEGPYAEPTGLSQSAWRDGVECRRTAHRHDRYSAHGERPKRRQAVEAAVNQGDLRARTDEPSPAGAGDVRVGGARRVRGGGTPACGNGIR